MVRNQDMTWDNPVMYLKYGRDLARKGDYKRALMFMDEALKQKGANVLDILDNRSAIYSKMGKYDLALRDARHMVKINNLDGRGYLRAAKALLLEGKPEKAREVYSYALKTLPENHPQRSLVEELHTKLASRMEPKRRDPFRALPAELVFLILKHLNFKTILKMMQVCKGWNQFLLSYPEPWLKLDFYHHRKIPLKAMRTYLARSRGSLKHLSANLNREDGAKVLEIIKGFRNIEHFNFSCTLPSGLCLDVILNFKQLKCLILRVGLGMVMDNIVDILRELPKLQTLHLREAFLTDDRDHGSVPPKLLPNLKRFIAEIDFVAHQPSGPLTLPWYKPMPVPAPFVSRVSDEEAWNRVPKLEELRLECPKVGPTPAFNLSMERLRYGTSLRILTLWRVALVGPVVFPPNLEHLSLVYCRRSTPISENDATLEGVRLPPKLKSLVLANVNFIKDQGFYNLLTSLPEPTLEMLRVEQYFDVQRHHLISLVQNSRVLRNLKHLWVEGMYTLCDRDLAALLPQLPNLRELHIPNTSITGVSIRTIVELRTFERARRENVESGEIDDDERERRPFLETLTIQGCENLSEDAVQFGRSMGLKIKKESAEVSMQYAFTDGLYW